MGKKVGSSSRLVEIKMPKLGESGFSIGFRAVAVLTIISLASATSLGFIHNLTEARIEKSEQQQVDQALFKIFPEADNIAEIESQVYRASKNGTTIGYAGIGEGRGYGGFSGGFIKLAVGVDTEGEIVRVRIIKQSETPGLGSRIVEENFLGQFDGIDIVNNIDYVELRKENGKVEAITGATISSQAVVDTVREKADELREYLGD